MNPDATSCRLSCIYAVRLSSVLRSFCMLASDLDFMLAKCCLLHIDRGHSTQSSNAPLHNRYSDMLFLSEAPSTWVNGKQLSSIIVSVAFHTLRVAKHVPRLTAHRATPTIRKTRLLCPQAFRRAYPSQPSSHAASAPASSPAATVVSVLRRHRGRERNGVEARQGCKCVAALLGVGRDASWSVSA